MARTKEPAKPLYDLRLDFYASMDAHLNESIMFLQAVQMTIRHPDVPEIIKEVLLERLTAFRATLMSGE